MAGRIEGRGSFSGTGMLGDREYLDELEERKQLHERLTRGKPRKSFAQIFEEKLHGKAELPPAETPERGAKDPLLGLSPGQSTELAEGTKGRRAGQVILKG